MRIRKNLSIDTALAKKLDDVADANPGLFTSGCDVAASILRVVFNFTEVLDACHSAIRKMREEEACARRKEPASVEEEISEEFSSLADSTYEGRNPYGL